MAALPSSARELIESGAIAHFATVNPDGSPQVTCVWVGLDGDEIVSGHLRRHQKVKNVERDPRVVLSIEGRVVNEVGLREYLTIRGRARVEQGGAPELLHRLAHVYMDPKVKFPPMPDPPPGFVIRVTVDRVGGIGPWAESSA